MTLVLQLAQPIHDNRLALCRVIGNAAGIDPLINVIFDAGNETGNVDDRFVNFNVMRDDSPLIGPPMKVKLFGLANDEAQTAIAVENAGGDCHVMPS